MQRIPPQFRWTGPYLGNYYGDLWKTFNVDLEREEGKIALSRRMQKVADTLNAGDTGLLPLGLIKAFVRTDADCTSRWWALSDVGRVFRTASPNFATSAWGADTYANTPTNARDMAVFGNDSRADSGRGQLFVTKDTTIAVLNDTGANTWTADWWTSTMSMTALKSGFPHPIETIGFRNVALVGDGHLVHMISRVSDTANEEATYGRLILPIQYRITKIISSPRRAWFLAFDNTGLGKDGIIAEWDGVAQSVNAIHSAHGRFPLSGVDYNGTPIVINDRGFILEFTGNGFAPMIRNGQLISLPIAQGTTLTLDADGIAPRGMIVGEDRLIYINVDAPTAESPRQLGGIWCLNPITGRLYNKHALGQWGDTDFGAQDISVAGALYPIPAAHTAVGFLAGGQINKDITPTVHSAIWTLVTEGTATANRGHFVTQFIPASDVREAWDTIWIRFKAFITAGNRIIVKARGTRPLVTALGRPIQKTITWTSTTSFTVTLASSDDALAVGDEVEILAGDNAGITAHISTISGNHAALQTITIDETVVSSAATATARFDRWKKLGAISGTSYEEALNIGITSSFIQFKVEMRGPAHEMEISDMIVNPTPNLYNKK